MSDTNTTDANATLRQNKFGVAFSAIGAVGAVIYAVQTKRHGKFWWFIGGSIIGSAVGLLLDSMANEKK